MPRNKSSEREMQRLLTHIAALERERDQLKKRDRSYQAIFDRVTDRLASGAPAPTAAPGTFAGLSLVIAYYDIPEQIERTLTSCAPGYQGVDPGEVEVIVVDNGSSKGLPADLQERFPHVSQILRVDGRPSPVFAMNAGIAAARFEMVGLMIDGAHMLSPGVVRNIRDIWRMFPNPVVSVPQYILGAQSQNLTDHADAFVREAAALEELNWPDDGYGLFDYAVYPGENYHRTFVEAIETNCLITTRRILDDLGGFDERYDEPGAGFANLEIFSRLIHEPSNTYVVLSGEGSFHQDHSGTTTQRTPEERDMLVADYKIRHHEVTGSDAVLNARSPVLYGKTRRHTQRIPTISREFGRVSNRLLKQLANIFVARTRAGMTDDYQPVLSVGGAADERLARAPLAPLGLLPNTARVNGVPQKALGYLRCLNQVHQALRPSLYFEIGIDTGSSLALARCPAIGVDPSFVISNPQTSPRQLFRETSDAFFADHARCKTLFADGIDLAFIDGMHLSEFVLRDFIETEKWMRPGGVVLIDDVLPDRMEMLERARRFNAWCGDVYKIVPILRRYRPDLTVTVFETFIGPYRKGLAVVSGLDPENRTLDARYDQIAAEIEAGQFDVPTIPALERLLAPEPIEGLRRATGAEPASNLSACLAADLPRDAAGGSQVPSEPKLSVVVVAHDMARELPRTLRSLSPDMQRGVTAQDYEIVVVDNGSAEPADMHACLAVAPNARVITLPAGRVSPCRAANLGVAAARAEFCGVVIDGARMASPGVLKGALDALGGDRAALVGVHGFHLGSDVQSEAVAKGYSASAEDALLSKTDWEEDGYRLFDISVFSKSSGKGWRVLPSETTALFMSRARWKALDGYDEGFVSDGGGLANLDIWKRACELPGTSVCMLLGEGTFHQIHGGVTTNSAVSRRTEFDREYQDLRGAAYRRPEVDAVFLGQERTLGGAMAATGD